MTKKKKLLVLALVASSVGGATGVRFLHARHGRGLAFGEEAEALAMARPQPDGWRSVRHAVQVDTPPPLQQAPGWPFEALPSVDKFTSTVPAIHLANSLTDYWHEPLLRDVTPFTQLLAMESSGPSAAWALPPLAAAGGLALGSRESSITHPPTVVPEPSTILLLATGLLLVALIAARRKRTERG